MVIGVLGNMDIVRKHAAEELFVENVVAITHLPLSMEDIVKALRMEHYPATQRLVLVGALFLNSWFFYHEPSPVSMSCLGISMI